MKMKMISTLSVISGILLSGSVLAASATDTGTYVPVTYVTQGDPDGSVPKKIFLHYQVTSFDGLDSAQSGSVYYNVQKNLPTHINVDGKERLWGVQLDFVQEDNVIYSVDQTSFDSFCGAWDGTYLPKPAQGINLVRETLSNGSISYSCRIYSIDPTKDLKNAH